MVGFCEKLSKSERPSSKTGRQLTELDLSKKDNFLGLDKINIGFAVQRVTENLITQDLVTIS